MTIINGVNKGIIPKGTKQLLANGTYDVELYKNAEVIVPTTAPERYLEFENDNGTLKKKNKLVYLDGITTISDYALAYAYYGIAFPANTSLDLSSVTTVETNGFYYAFKNASNITSVDLSGVTTIDIGGLNYMFVSSSVTSCDLSGIETLNTANACSYMFDACTGLTSFNLSSIKKIDANYCCNYMFRGCNNLTSVPLSSLQAIVGTQACYYMFQNCRQTTSVDLSSLVAVKGSSACSYMFDGCTGLTSVDLNSLKSITETAACTYMFRNCSALTTLSFPALKFVTNSTLFNFMLNNTSGVTVHFPSNMSSYNFAPGGTGTTVLYDLPATNILTGANSVNYERNPKYDTATALAWRVEDTGTAPNFVVDWTPFYTSGTTDPVVNDTIYSDSACTTAVTTISSIA